MERDDPNGGTGAGAGPGRTATEDSGPPRAPFTLAVDVGGSGLKASVLDAGGAMVADRVRVPTPYPLSPDRLVDTLGKLVKPLPTAARASVGFPGMVREGLVLSAPHFSTTDGRLDDPDPELLKQWTAGFPLARALTDAFSLPTKVANDADIQGAAVVSGKGLELIITLGTGFGTGLFYQGHLLPHLEIGHQPFRKGETYDQQLGEVTRKEIGHERWNKRLNKAVANLRALMFFDHLYIGGGNSRRVRDRHQLGDDVTVVDNSAGILGGIKLWESDHIGINDVDEEPTRSPAVVRQ